MPTYRQVIRQYENRLAEKDRDSNVPKVLFYHFAHKEPHQLYLMMDEEAVSYTHLTLPTIRLV